MHNKNEIVFQGQIETVFKESISDIDIKVKNIFKVLRVMSHLTSAGIRKLDGFPAFQLLYALVNLIFMHIGSVSSFAKRNLVALSPAKKDTFYRFKNKDFAWRSFHWRLVARMQKLLNWSKIKKKEACFVLDATCLSKRGQKIEEVSYIYDHSQKKSVIGFEVLALGLVNAQGFFPLDFGYHFSKDKSKHYRPASPSHTTSSTARRIKEAGLTKLDLSIQMLQTALAKGIEAAYVLFDRWFTSPKFMKDIRELGLHCIGRLKKDDTGYCYNGQWLTLTELYQIKKSDLILNKELGYQLAVAPVTCSNGLRGNIVFSKGYQEPEIEKRNGTKSSPKSTWAAFFSTDPYLAASEVVKKFIIRWSIEVFFKEAKTMLGLGKDQSQSFEAQICSTTLTFLRYNILAFLKEQEKGLSTIGELFLQVEQEIAPLSYLDKIFVHFRQFLLKTLEVIGRFATITIDFREYVNIIINVINNIPLCQGCET
jgi:hypothetical protein